MEIKMAKMDWYENERRTGLLSREYYTTYIVQRDDGSGRRTFTDMDEAEDYYHQLQALDNQEESLRLQRQEAAERAEQIRIQKQNQQPDWIRRMPPRLPQQPAIRKCAKCGASLLDDSICCHNCGTKRKECSCGGFLDAGMKFCPKCGKITPEEERRLAEEKLRSEKAWIAEQKREEEERRRAEEARIAEQKREVEEKQRMAEEQKRQQKLENFKFWWGVFCVLLGVIMFIIVAILTDGFNHPL